MIFGINSNHISSRTNKKKNYDEIDKKLKLSLSTSKFIVQ